MCTFLLALPYAMDYLMQVSRYLKVSPQFSNMINEIQCHDIDHQCKNELKKEKTFKFISG